MSRADRACPACGCPSASGATSEPDRDDAETPGDGCPGALSDVDLALEQQVLRLLDSRASGATICPSEAARAVGGERWRYLMGPAREAAARLVARGEMEVTQAGEVVDLATARGPVRVRRSAQP